MTRSRIVGSFATDSGMLGLWDPAHFSDVIDYESWEARFLEDEDIKCLIEAGQFTPINIGGDGCFGVEVRIGTLDSPAALTQRENQFLTVKSEPYLFVSAGLICVGGIDAVASVADPSTGIAEIPPGRYAVVIHLIDWELELGARLENRKPAPSALPDFTILLNPCMETPTTYRCEVRTFPPPKSLG